MNFEPTPLVHPSPGRIHSILSLFFSRLFVRLLVSMCSTGRNRSEEIRKNTRLPKFFITSSISLYEKYSHKIPSSIRNTVSSHILCLETLRSVQIEQTLAQVVMLIIITLNTVRMQFTAIDGKIHKKNKLNNIYNKDI